MSTKKSHKSTPSHTTTTSRLTRRHARAATAAAKRARTASAAATSDATPEANTAGERDPRLPPAGTVVKKVDRHGNVRCQCRVVREGIRYNGRVYRSLSAAAMAAAGDLGLESPTQNGYVFWGLQALAAA